ncbi:MAG: class I SAM-dependent methyltransferase [Paludibaculum sp.]
MPIRSTSLLRLAAAVSLLPAAGLNAQVHHQQHPPQSSAEYARVLEDPSRDAWQKPHEVIMALELKSTETIADIGAGSGYFSRRFANHAGKVYAVDIDKDLLALAAKDAPANLSTILAEPNDPKLPAGGVDTIFLCDVLHHISGRPAYYGKLRAALKPGGRIVIVDFYKKDLPVGPPPAMKLSDDEVKKELAAAGFRLVKSHEFLPHQYFLVFQAR